MSKLHKTADKSTSDGTMPKRTRHPQYHGKPSDAPAQRMEKPKPRKPPKDGAA